MTGMASLGSNTPVPPSPWAAPRAGAPVCGEVTVPASKSLTNRYLLLAALAEGPSVVVNALDSRDSRLMLAALEALGASVEPITDWEGTGEHAVRITPLSLPSGSERSRSGVSTGEASGTSSTSLDQEHTLGGGSVPRTAGTEDLHVDCGLAGTVMRFLPAVAALTGRTVHFDGDPEARLRPMGAVLEGLRALDTEISRPGQDALPSTLPFTVRSPQGLEGGEVSIDASASSQFVSGLLLAAPRMRSGLTLRHSGDVVPSSEHVAMTVKVLQDFGVDVDTSEPFVWRVRPATIPAFTARVEPDLSNAGPFLVAAAVTGGEVTIPGWPRETTQIGRRWTELLPQFGAEVITEPESTEGTVRLTVRGGRSQDGSPQLTSPGTVDGTAELTPTVAAMAALSQGETKFTSIQHLRGHETDRIAALVAEIRRLGGTAEETPDGFRILSPITQSGTVRSYADHRMATFGAILGLRVDGVEVEDIGCTSKTMPEFPALWRNLVEISPGLQSPRESLAQAQTRHSAPSAPEKSTSDTPSAESAPGSSPGADD